MVIRTHYRPRVRVFNESHWITTRKRLDSLDLASNYDGSLYEHFKRQFQINRRNQKVFFERPWIKITGKQNMYPGDDCRVIFKWFSDDMDSIFFNLAIKSRDPDWLGRNIFLRYFDKIILQERYLESGESAVKFLHVATLCGFNKWSNTNVRFRKTDQERTDYRVHRVAHIVFHYIYPSIMRGLFQIREEHPLLLKTFWDMLCVSHSTRCLLFARIPDAQHLEFLLDVGKQTCFNFWGIRDGEPSYFEGAVSSLIIQGRFHLLTILLRHGFTFKGSPLTLIKVIIKSMYPYNQDFIPSPEFKEMFRKLLESLPYPFEPPKKLREKLLHFYKCLLIRGEDIGRFIGQERDERGSKTVLRLVKAYATCGIDCDDMKPRTLSHLSRQVVRTLLGGNFQLPAGIDALPVSGEVKEFLNLGS